MVELTAEEAIKLNPKLKDRLEREIAFNKAANGEYVKQPDKENAGDANVKDTKDKSYMQSERVLKKMREEWDLLH